MENFDPQIVKNKLGLINLAQQLNNISRACKLMGVSRNTFYVGTIKGVGRIYQQNVVDTFSKVIFAKLYNMKTSITAEDALNDKVILFFEGKKVPILRMLTDRGTEFCGRPEDHQYQLYLLIYEIDHTKTKARHPQPNGICVRFNKTILEEFNGKRTHQGKHCLGRMPMETFLDGLKKWQKKNLTTTK